MGEKGYDVEEAQRGRVGCEDRLTGRLGIEVCVQSDSELATSVAHSAQERYDQISWLL